MIASITACGFCAEAGCHQSAHIVGAGGDQVGEFLHLGAAGFVPKSMASETLVSAIRFVLSGGVYIPADLLDDVTRGAGILGLPERGRDMLGQPTTNRVQLTERQEQVLQLLARGAPIKIICRELGLSEGTVKTHVTAIYRAFGASNRTEALLAARRQGYDVG